MTSGRLGGRAQKNSNTPKPIENKCTNITSAQTHYIHLQQAIKAIKTTAGYFPIREEERRIKKQKDDKITEEEKNTFTLYKS